MQSCILKNVSLMVRTHYANNRVNREKIKELLSFGIDRRPTCQRITLVSTVQPHFPAASLPNMSAATERGYLTQVTWPGLSFP